MALSVTNVDPDQFIQSQQSLYNLTENHYSCSGHFNNCMDSFAIQWFELYETPSTQ